MTIVKSPNANSRLTLALCTLLHGLTHAYGVMLVPLYLLMTDDLRLGGVADATFIVTIYGTVYFIGSFISGELADRYDRKLMLGLGLIGNALAIGLMGLTRDYHALVALGVLAGIAGTFFHPAANALVTAHFSRNPGMAIGWMGIGAGIGFFVGPQYAGWRAKTQEFWWIDVSAWQLPCIELGLIGLLIGVIFFLVAREAPRGADGADGDDRRLHKHQPMGAALRWRIVRTASILSLRDFAGVATISLASIYLQKAHALDTKQTGFILGAMMLSSVIVNPLIVALSPGWRRLPALGIVLVLGGAILTTVPLWSIAWVLPVLLAFQTCQLGSYAVADAAVLERVSPAVRGRVIGLWLTVAGTLGSLGPVAAGWQADHLSERASQPIAYLPAFAILGALMAASAMAVRMIARLGPPVTSVQIASEVAPATMGTVGS